MISQLSDRQILWRFFCRAEAKSDDNKKKRKMKRIRKHVSIITSVFLTAFASADSQAAVLCKKLPAIFTCPIVENISANGSGYDYVGGAYEGTWTATGPWGSGSSAITVSGNSRCSGTSGSYAVVGNPSSGGGTYCWCQMTNAGLSGAWAFRDDYGGASYCASNCALVCAHNVRFDSAFRSAVCVPPSS
jgi:hypothetical protein